MQRILVPTDGSNHSKRALAVASDLAVANEGRLLLLHVLLRKKEAEEIEAMAETARLAPDVMMALREALAGAPTQVSAAAVMADPTAPCRPAPRNVLQAIGDAVLNTAVADTVSRGIVAEKMPPTDGDAASAILETIREQSATAVVMGCRGLGDLEAFTFGSVSR
jgi:nucleotide-binding universal stress UspA family protein